ncbi:MAG: YciI family protein [Deltaproteobacteria bacterium]|nr:MAG: YciI family protein [Deltaproteobacteria bacterium]
MRFMMFMIPKGYGDAAADTTPPPEDVEKMARYNEELQQAGVLISLDGLYPPAVGARVHFSGGDVRVAHGPFPEAGEVVGGYWMIRVGSLDEAVAWARRCPVVSHDATIEIRRVFELEDFPADVQEAAKTSVELSHV